MGCLRDSKVSLLMKWWFMRVIWGYECHSFLCNRCEKVSFTEKFILHKKKLKSFSLETNEVPKNKPNHLNESLKRQHLTHKNVIIIHKQSTYKTKSILKLNRFLPLFLLLPCWWTHHTTLRKGWWLAFVQTPPFMELICFDFQRYSQLRRCWNEHLSSTDCLV